VVETTVLKTQACGHHGQRLQYLITGKNARTSRDVVELRSIITGVQRLYNRFLHINEDTETIADHAAVLAYIEYGSRKLESVPKRKKTNFQGNEPFVEHVRAFFEITYNNKTQESKSSTTQDIKSSGSITSSPRYKAIKSSSRHEEGGAGTGGASGTRGKAHSSDDEDEEDRIVKSKKKTSSSIRSSHSEEAVGTCGAGDRESPDARALNKDEGREEAKPTQHASDNKKGSDKAEEKAADAGDGAGNQTIGTKKEESTETSSSSSSSSSGGGGREAKRRKTKSNNGWDKNKEWRSEGGDGNEDERTRSSRVEREQSDIAKILSNICKNAL
jgi:hypothetical protein